MAPASWEKRRVGQGAMLLTWIDVHSDNDMHHHCLNNVAEVGSDEHRTEGVLTVVSSITQQQTTIFEYCSLFGCHIAVGDMAPGFHMQEISGSRVSLLTYFHLWVLAIIGEPWWMMVVGGGLPLAGCVGRFCVREMSGGGVGINVGWRHLKQGTIGHLSEEFDKCLDK